MGVLTMMLLLSLLSLSFILPISALVRVSPQDYAPLSPAPVSLPLKVRDPSSDDYIDKILSNLRDVIINNGLDPSTLPDQTAEFSKHVLGIEVHGSAKLYNGKFWGLSTIARTGDTSFNVDGTKVRLTAHVGVNRPSAHYDARAEFMGISMDILDGAGLQLTNFAISHVGRITVDVSGLGPLNWILETLVSFVDTFLKDWIVSLVEGPLKDLIQDLLNKYVPDIPHTLM